MIALETNPSLETPPNFQALGFTPIRQALMAQNQDDGAELDDEGATQQLLDTWEAERKTRQEAWEEAVAEEARERAEAEAERLQEEEETRKTDEKKRKTKFPPIVLGMPPPKGSGFRLYQKAIAKLETLEFVEMWFFTFAVTRSRCARYAFSPGISTPPLSLSTIDSCREALNRVATHPPLPTSSPCALNRAAKIATVGRSLSTPTHHIPSPPNPTATPLQHLYCRNSLWFATRTLVKSPSVSMCRSRLSRLSPNQPIMCRVD